jgi:hypothetical protein
MTTSGATTDGADDPRESVLPGDPESLDANYRVIGEGEGVGLSQKLQVTQLSAARPIAPETAERYAQIADRVTREATRALGHPETAALNPVVVVTWLIDHQSERSFATWRQYRCGMIYALSQRDDTSAREAVEILSNAGFEGDRRPSQYGQTRKRGFPPGDRHAILLKVRASRSEWWPCTEYWIRATVLTGLRPSEWSNAVWLDTLPPDLWPARPAEAYGKLTDPTPDVPAGPWLKVKNAKVTAERCATPANFRECRILDLGPLPEKDREFVAKHLQVTKLLIQRGQLGAAQDASYNMLRVANRALWPRRAVSYTIYACRHQFAANAKALYPRHEVAALMGHFNDLTAITNYARRDRAEFGMEAPPDAWRVTALPRPHPDDVLAVRRNELRDFSGSKGPMLDAAEVTDGPGPCVMDGEPAMGVDDNIDLLTSSPIFDGSVGSAFGS